MKKLVLLLCSLILSALPLFSQTVLPLDTTFQSDFVHTNWTTSDGLPGMTITTLIQDRTGYLWIGTYDGLVRFDGLEFTVYNRTVDDKYDFASARSLLQDTAGNIWVGHNDEGLSCLHPDGTVIKYTMIDGLPNNKVNALCEDEEHNIWVGTASGICYITPWQRIVVPSCFADIGQENLLVRELYCDTAGRVWAITGQENDLFVCTGSRSVERFAGFRKLPGAAVYTMMQDKAGAFWFGCNPYYMVRVKDGEETVYNIHHEGMNASSVNGIMQDRDGNLWISSDFGITVLHGGMMTCWDSRDGLVDNATTRIIEDTEGNIWAGFNRGGLQKMSLGKFRTVSLPVSVNAICEDTDRGVTWLGTDGGVYCYKDNRFLENAVTRFFKGMRVRHVGLTADGELLVSSYSDKPQVRVAAGSMDAFTVWTEKDGLSGSKGRIAIKTSAGDYYVGTPTGLNIVHHEDGHISTLTRADGFVNHYVMWIFEDRQQQVWVGTNGGGVYVLQDEKIVRHYSTENGLSGNVIFKILENDGSIWIGTGTGLSCYVEETDSFVNFNSRTGLGTDSVFQMICDYSQTVWMTSNRGIFSAPLSELQDVVEGKREKVSVRYYGSSDGLITSGVTSTSLSARDSQGRIWFTLTDGFAIYDPLKSGKNLLAPKIEVQSYTIDNVTSDYHGETIVLPPSAKRLSIKFTGLSFISSDSMRFCYRLGGFEQEYSDWSAMREVSYTNLLPGSYQFSLMVQNSDGVQGLLGNPVAVVKEPYLWQLVWFRLLISLLIVGLSALLVFSKIRSMKRYQTMLEDEVEVRTHELKLEKEKSESLLLNILPLEVAKELTEHPERTIAQKFPNVTVLFTDIVGFTKISGGMTAEEVVTMLNKMVSKFDERAKLEGIEKIKTIGDAYMAAAGLTEQADNGGAVKMINFALGLLEDVKAFNEESPVQVHIRIGVNTGDLVAGVIGKSKFIYDIWGDTVNVASRMESTGQPMCVHVTEDTYRQACGKFTFSEGVELEVKGKGTMKTYFLQ